MNKYKKYGMAAFMSGLLLTIVSLQMDKMEEDIFGLSSDFVRGFLTGLSIVLMVVAIVQFTKKPAKE